jgi:hypothetical protein
VRSHAASLHALISAALRPAHRPPPPQPTFCGAALRHRDLKASASEFSAKFLSREVDYARSSTSVYARVLKEVHGAKADIAQLDAKHVGALGRQLSGARLVAARLAGLL